MGAYNFLHLSPVFIEPSIRISLNLQLVVICVVCLLLDEFFRRNYGHKAILGSDFTLSYLRDVRLESITWVTESTPP